MSIKIKLIKGLSYRGGKDGKLRATKDKPFCVVETMEEAQAAIASGHFQLIGEVEPEKKEADKTSDPDGNKSISRMTKDELEAYAEEIGIDISDCKNNDERKEAIKKALEEDSTKEDDPYGKNEDNPEDEEDPKMPFEEE